MKRNSNSSKISNKTRCPLSPHLLDRVLEVLARAIKQLKRIKGIQIGKEAVKASLFADNMILYISDSKNCSRELPQLINTYSKVPRFMINLKKQSVALLYTNHKKTEKEIGETTPFTIATNDINYISVTLSKQVKNLHDKNVVSEERNWRRYQKMKDLLCS